MVPLHAGRRREGLAPTTLRRPRGCGQLGSCHSRHWRDKRAPGTGQGEAVLPPVSQLGIPSWAPPSGEVGGVGAILEVGTPPCLRTVSRDSAGQCEGSDRAGNTQVMSHSRSQRAGGLGGWLRKERPGRADDHHEVPTSPHHLCLTTAGAHPASQEPHADNREPSCQNWWVCTCFAHFALESEQFYCAKTSALIPLVRETHGPPPQPLSSTSSLCLKDHKCPQVPVDL